MVRRRKPRRNYSIKFVNLTLVKYCFFAGASGPTSNSLARDRLD